MRSSNNPLFQNWIESLKSDHIEHVPRSIMPKLSYYMVIPFVSVWSIPYGESPDIKQLANSYQILILRFQIVLHFAAVMLSDGQFASFVKNIHFCSDDTLNVSILCRLIESCVLITSLLNTVPVRSWFRHIPCMLNWSTGKYQ